MIEKKFWDLTDEEFESRSYPGTLTNEEAKKMDAEIRESRKLQAASDKMQATNCDNLAIDFSKD
jgi:hypothetical protein